MSDENHHELMDVVGSLVRPEIHENCMHSAGDVIIWIGERQKHASAVYYDDFCHSKATQTRL